MKRDVKFKALLCTLLVSGSISANADIWNSFLHGAAGDDGNPKTVGNAGAKQAQAKTQDIQVKIFNKTNTGISSIKFVDNAGKSLFSVNVSNCLANSMCTVKVSSAMIVKNGAIYMYDQQNKLASIYSFLRVNSQTKNISILANASSLGVYALNKMQASQPKVNYTLLASSIGSLGQQNDPFTVLGTSIMDQMSANGQDLNKALIATTNELLSGKKLVLTSRSVTQLKTVALASVAPSSMMLKDGNVAETVFCGAGFKSAMGIFGSISGFSMPWVGVISSVINGVTGSACPSGGGTDYSAQFDKITAQLNEISNQISALNTTVKGMRQDTLWNQIATNSQEYEKRDNDINGWVNNYFDVLKIKGKDGRIHANLKSLVDSYGGTKQALTNSPIKAALTNLLSNSQTTLKNPVLFLSSNNVGGINSQLTTNIQKMCGSSKDITGDALTLRAWCNLINIQVYSTNKILATALATIVPDVQATYSETNGDPVYAQLPTTTDISSYNASIDSYYDPQKFSIEYIKNSELPKQMISDIAESAGKFKCMINEWYPNESYLLTTCNSNGVAVKSKYYYKQKDGTVDSEVMNVMGVFVPKRFFHGGEGGSYGNNDAFPWLEWSFPALDSVNATNACGSSSCWDDLWFEYYLNVPKNVVTSYYGTDLSTINTDTIASMNYSIDYKRNDKPYTRSVLAKTDAKSDSNKDMLLTKFYAADYWGFRDNDIFSFMRYTDNLGYSHVWTMRNKFKNNTGGSNYVVIIAETSMQCMTNDCSLGTDDKQIWYTPTIQGQLKFSADNLTIAWSNGNDNSNACRDVGHGNHSNSSKCEYNMTVNGKPSF